MNSANPEARAFLNVCNILRSIDRHELEDAKIIPLDGMTDPVWHDFKEDPIRCMRTMDDKRINALWGIVKARGGNPPPQTQELPCSSDVASSHEVALEDGRGYPSSQNHLRVKPLEWDDVGLSWQKAETPLGIYTVEPSGVWHFEQIGEDARFGSPDAASARKDAEAHYQDRVSALFDSPSPETREVGN